MSKRNEYYPYHENMMLMCVQEDEINQPDELDMFVHHYTLPSILVMRFEEWMSSQSNKLNTTKR